MFKSVKIFLSAIVLNIFLFYPVFAMAQQVTLSITPPLIKNNIVPGQVWQSSIKLVNNNNQDIDAYVEVADFKGRGESGTVDFISSAEAGENAPYLASNWVVIESGPFQIPANKSKNIPFIVEVPEDASPGGHYFAILAGTKPPEEKISGASIKVSSMLASLVFLTVKGEVNEEGRIGQFSVPKTIFTEPEVDFTVRFDNIGNVHVQPKGEIKVYDLFNNDKGSVTLNHNTEFGNVLPQEKREWKLKWTGSGGLLEMGRYKAVLVLNYGSDGKRTLDQTVYFWVIQFKELLIILGSLALFVLLMALSIRRYVKKAILKTQERAVLFNRQQPLKKAGSVKTSASNVLDLKNQHRSDESHCEKGSSRSGPTWRFVKNLSLFIIVLAITLIAGLIFLNKDLFTKSREDMDTIEKNPIEKNEIKSEFVENKEGGQDPGQNDQGLATSTGNGSMAEKTATSSMEKTEKATMAVLNGSGRPGLASEAKDIVEKAGYEVSRIGNAASYDYRQSIIRHKEGRETLAGKIKDIFAIEMEMETNEEQTEDIVIILGSNF